MTFWKPPPQDVVKLNIDARVARGIVAGGGLLRDHEGNLIFAFYKEFGQVDVLIAKGLALLQGPLGGTGPFVGFRELGEMAVM